MKEKIDWQKHIKSLFFQKSGEHALVGGTTGSGKTQTLFFMVKSLVEYHKKEIIIWFDVGKTSEVLRLADFRDIIFFVPAGCTIDIAFNPGFEQYLEKIDYREYSSFKEFLELIEKDKINILCIKPFEKSADEYAKKISEFFKVLIKEALSYHLEESGKTPMALIFDEMQWIAPGHGHALNEAHTDASKDVQLNIDTLRSQMIRFIGATQNWTKIRAGVRDACSWIFIKRGLTFTRQDEWRLSRYNLKWQMLPTEHTVVAFPNRNFSDYIELPYFGEGGDIGKIYYRMKDQEPISSSDSEKGYA